MSKLRLTLGCWNYDRTRGLLEGRVQPDGIDLNYLEHAGRGDLLPHAAQPRVRRRGDVALVVHGVAVHATRAVHRDPGVSVALLPPFVHLRQCGQRHPRAEGPDRQAHRQPRIPDDGAGVDSRHPVRRVRRAGRQRRPTTPAARKSRAATRSSKLDLPPNIRVEPIGADADAVGDAARAARSTRCTRRACRRRSMRGDGKRAAPVRGLSCDGRADVLPQDAASSRSCTRS